MFLMKNQRFKLRINHIQEYDIFPADKLGEPRTSELTSGDGIAEPEKVLRRDIIFHPDSRWI